jgi:hypothetical protein
MVLTRTARTSLYHSLSGFATCAAAKNEYNVGLFVSVSNNITVIEG